MSIIEQIISILAPHECVNCRREGDLLCRECSLLKLSYVPETCYRCNRLSQNYQTCISCRASSNLRRVWVRAEYSEIAKELIHKLKFVHAREAALVAAREMASLSPVLPKDTLIAHIPAVTSHVRERGFDQAALIARELAKILKLKHVNCLARMGQQHQIGASRHIRRQQMAKAFRPLSQNEIEGSKFLLVDDVLTTGSTLEAGALILREAGAKSVDAIVFAKVKL